nr:pyridoxal-phosphate dependent enzyme [Candidatus Microthrix sp.]
MPETLIPACEELEVAFRDAWVDPAFRSELDGLLADYAGRPSPLTEAHRLSGGARLPGAAQTGGPQPHRLAQDQQHAGPDHARPPHGQVQLVAETGAGQHGVATATAAALLGMECIVYMGEVDMARQELNVFRMRLLGAEVRSAMSGSRTLKDAVNEAMRSWAATVETTHYCLGSVMGPHPYPWMVREFHRVIGDEASPRSTVDRRRPRRRRRLRGWWIERSRNLLRVRRYRGRAGRRRAAGGAAIGGGAVGVVHGMASYLKQDDVGQVMEAHSISAGLDYPGVGPEHSFLAAEGRARYEPVTDAEVIEAFVLLSRTEASSRPSSRPTPSPGCPGQGRAPRQDRAHQPVGARRQGRRPDDGGAGDERRSAVTSRARNRRCAAVATPGQVPRAPTSPVGWGVDPHDRGGRPGGADAIEIGIPFPIR